MSGFFLRGALVEFLPTPLIPVPNVIVFQFNPETMTHAWTQPEAASSGQSQTKGNPMAVKGTPSESFSFTLQLDAGDLISEGGPAGALATASGVYSRIAALEMLLQPAQSTSKKGALIATVSSAVGAGAAAAAGADKRDVPAYVMNPVLLVWGPGRVVPVRVTSLSITEQLYDELLNPTKAEVHIALSVLTKEELKVATGLLADVSSVARKVNDAQREALAIADNVNAVQSIVGMIAV